MNKIFLLDAYALIYRAYYAFIKNPRINSKGLNTSAILGFVNTLEDVINKEQPTHLAVAFDPSGPTFRHEAYPAYKAQREETPEAIRAAVPYIKRIMEAYHIPLLEVKGYEADDVIGTATVMLDDGETDIYMMTPDKDYAQLVKPHVTMYRPGTGGKDAEKLGPAEVKAKYGIEECSQMIDLLALMGDSSDNIPGCRGVGEKTASKLIQQFGSVENLLANTEQVQGALRDKVEQSREQIVLSKWLATIKTDVPIELNLDALRREEPDSEALRKLYEELEFRMFLSKMRSAPKPAPKTNEGYAGDLFSVAGVSTEAMPKEETPAQAEPQEGTSRLTVKDLKPTYHLVKTAKERKELLKRLKAAPIVCLDTETTSTNAMDARLVGLSFAVSEGEAWYVPATDEGVAAEFRPVYESDTIMKVGQNLKYDLTVLENYGITLHAPMFDTMLAHYLIAPTQKHGMDDMAEVYLNYQTIHIEELIGPKGKKQKNMADLTPEEVYVYACEDADVTLRLKSILEKKLREQGCESLFRDIEMPLMPVLARMERNGVRIDTEGLKETSALFTREMEAIEKDIIEQAGKEFNISSPKQVGELLFDHLHISHNARKTKKGQYSTDEKTMEALRHKHPIVEKILEFRGLKKLLSTYIDSLPLLINPRTGHIHTSFNQAVASTGRLSSSNPNLQNIPVRGAQGKEVRKAFIPEEGELFLSADYSQIELRLMAHLSQDANMIEDFRTGHDIHAATAAKIFHKGLEDVTSDERRQAKTANFGIIYGISAFGLSESLGCSRAEAKQLIDGYFASYPGVRQYMDRSIATARQQGYTETLFHRRLELPDINSHNSVVRGYAERNAINAPIQGTAADIMKIATIRVDRRMRAEGMRSKMILQVHDELNFSVPPEEKEAMQRIVTEEMQAAAELSIPLVVDCGWGSNWLEAH